jgi:hypothetical protein
MFKLISHRGNICGRNINRENSPDYVLEAINLGYDVEIDVWVIDDKYYLGHDEPIYEVNENFLETIGFWCHAKNIDSLTKMLLNEKIHCFWHQNDDYCITTNKYIWTYPNKILSKNSICVLPEITDISMYEIRKTKGVCSDYIEKYL